MDAKKAKKSSSDNNRGDGKTQGRGGSREVPSDPAVILNSQEFPDLEMRPAMFRDDRLFNRLTFEHAARVMWEFSQSEEKKKEQQEKEERPREV